MIKISVRTKNETEITIEDRTVFDGKNYTKHGCASVKDALNYLVKAVKDIESEKDTESEAYDPLERSASND